MLAKGKCYCENCETEFNFKDGAWDDDNCPVCGNDNPDYLLIPIPDHETVQQREKRTGKPVSRKIAVFSKCIKPVVEDEDICEDCQNCWIGEQSGKWVATSLENLGDTTGCCDGCTCVFVIADPPTPPADDWRPEKA